MDATAGINLTHNLIVKATDTSGNSNTSVSISLPVLRRCDVVRDNVVDVGDALEIGKYTVGVVPDHKSEVYTCNDKGFSQSLT